MLKWRGLSPFLDLVLVIYSTVMLRKLNLGKLDCAKYGFILTTPLNLTFKDKPLQLTAAAVSSSSKHPRQYGPPLPCC